MGYLIPKILSTLLDAIETQAAEFGAQPQVLIHHFLLNKCLVHNPTPLIGWELTQ